MSRTLSKRGQTRLKTPSPFELTILKNIYLHIYTFWAIFTHVVKLPGHTRGNSGSRRLLSGTEGVTERTSVRQHITE